jgi:1-deoxy-D-xylulose-5-phosphate synthase
MFLPDRFVAHASPREQYDEAGLTARHIVAEVMAALEPGERVLDHKTLA